METFSTVLFVNHMPVGYRAVRLPDRLELSPAENPTRTVMPPMLIAEKHNDLWTVRGTENEDLVRQVLDEVHLSEQHTTTLDLSAAP